MGNSLLDFVMALVRDPEVSARYAADPAGMLAEAHLPGVTIADVNNLIPVVTDSLASSTPGFGSPTGAGNVWASGAAATAFDAFDIDIPRAEQPYQPAVTLPAPESQTDRPPHGSGVDTAPGAALDETPDLPALNPVNPGWIEDAEVHHPTADPGDSAAASPDASPDASPGGFELF